MLIPLIYVFGSPERERQNQLCPTLPVGIRVENADCLPNECLAQDSSP